MNSPRAILGRQASLAGLAVLVLVLAPWAVQAEKKEDKGKGAEASSKDDKGDGAKKEEVEKARAEVRDLMKQVQEDGEKLRKAMGRLAELEGRPPMPPIPWGWPGMGTLPVRPPVLPIRDRTAELEKKVDKLSREVEELKKELKK